jgi:DNA-directed RNA polymerase subunit RPC12/RpoP
MNRTAIKCNCGQRINQKDVMQTGYYMRMFGPSFVYVKFRCSRCKKLGEQFVKQEDWEDGILKETAAEHNSEEKERFEALGPIEMRELVEFHNALERPDSLAALNTELGKPAPGEAKDKKEK